MAATVHIENCLKVINRKVRSDFVKLRIFNGKLFPLKKNTIAETGTLTVFALLRSRVESE